MPRPVYRPGARREINRVLEFLEEQAGLEVAERFLDALMHSADQLAQHPQMGRLCGFTRPNTRRLRRWPVRGFDNWLIFYQPRRDGVEIVHVMHGARDIDAMLGPRQ
jgi:toxin ParE1/3/4